MLASINSNDPRAMADMLRRALAKWNSMTPEERMFPGEPGARKSEIRRAEDQYPSDGLALRVFCRDLPRESNVRDWRASAWNQSFLWYRKAEIESFLPQELRAGQKFMVPDGLMRRMATLNFNDHVRGQTLSYDDKDVEEAWLEMEVFTVAGGSATLRLTGKTRAKKAGSWSIDGFRDMDNPRARNLGMELDLYGSATVDLKKRLFTRFEMVAVGTRTGATQYNGRADDLGPAPIGFYIRKTTGTPVEKVAPDHFWRYGWR